MLRKEGFEFRNRVDIFDGGPTMHADFERIRVIRESRSLSIAEIVKEVSGPELMLGNSRLDFRCCLGRLELDQNGGAIIDQVTALQLKIKVGDALRAASLKPQRSDSTGVPG
jgi:arginine N-succinyltransferase